MLKDAYYVDLNKDQPVYKLFSRYCISEMSVEEQVDFLFDFFTWKDQNDRIGSSFL